MSKKSEDVITLGEAFLSTEDMPIKPEDWNNISKELQELNQELIELEARKKRVTELLKEKESRVASITCDIARKKISKSVNVFYKYNWDTGEKTKIAVCPADGENVEIWLGSITSDDRQLHLEMKI